MLGMFKKVGKKVRSRGERVKNYGNWKSLDLSQKSKENGLRDCSEVRRGLLSA